MCKFANFEWRRRQCLECVLWNRPRVREVRFTGEALKEIESRVDWWMNEIPEKLLKQPDFDTQIWVKCFSYQFSNDASQSSYEKAFFRDIIENLKKE